MPSDAADALAKTYARNKKLLSLRSITNSLQQTRIAGGLPIPRFGALDPAAERAAVGLASPMISKSSRRPRLQRREERSGPSTRLFPTLMPAFELEPLLAKQL